MLGIILIIFCLTILVSPVLRQKRYEFPFDVTRKVKGFYEEPKESLDIVFIGSSNLFSTINPAVLWREQGITSYVFGANEQNLSLSYFYIKEALLYQKPAAVVLDMFYCDYNELQREGVLRINLDDMRWGKNKIEAIKENVPKEEAWSYYFTIAKYHERWKDLGKEDFIVYRGRNPYKGWSPFGIPDKEVYPYTDGEETQELSAFAKGWLDKILECCRENHTDLILLITPNGNLKCVPDAEKGYRHVYGLPSYNGVAEYAGQRGIVFFNMNAVMSGVPHNDVLTSEKVSSCFGTWFQEKYHLPDKRGIDTYDYWNTDTDYGYRYIQEAEKGNAE